MFQRILCLIIKEFHALLRDPKSRIILIVPPMIQLFVFSFAATQEVKNVPIAILNQDLGKHGRELINRISGSRNFSRVLYVETEQQAADVIDSQRALMVVHIGTDFSRRMESGQGGEVQLLMDARRANAAQIVASYATQIAAQYQQEVQLGVQVRPPTYGLIPRVWFNENLMSTWSTVPALVAILSTVMGLMITALSIAREREMGTFDQLLVSPLSPTEILIGKSLPALFIGLVEASAMLAIGTMIIGVPFRGSLLLLYFSLTIFIMALIGVGLFISSLAKTQQQAIMYAFVFMVPAMLLSGFASPIGNMPKWLQTLTLANPIRHAMVILKGLFLKDMPAYEIFLNALPLIPIACFTLTFASYSFRRRLE